MSYPFNEVTAVFLLNSPRYHHTSHSDESLSYHDYLCHHDSPPPTPAHNLVILTVLHGAIGPSVRLAHGALKIILILIMILIYISVKMAASWGSLALLSFHSLCLHLRNNLTKCEVFQNTSS